MILRLGRRGRGFDSPLAPFFSRGVGKGENKAPGGLKNIKSTTTRFELARAEPKRFLIALLNHSDTSSMQTSRAVKVTKSFNLLIQARGTNFVSNLLMEFTLKNAARAPVRVVLKKG